MVINRFFHKKLFYFPQFITALKEKLRNMTGKLTGRRLSGSVVINGSTSNKSTLPIVRSVRLILCVLYDDI